MVEQINGNIRFFIPNLTQPVSGLIANGHDISLTGYYYQDCPGSVTITGTFSDLDNFTGSIAYNSNSCSCNGNSEFSAVRSTDTDQDGYFSPVDCNDVDATIHPNAIEVCGDGIDQDCNGSDLDCIIDGDGNIYKTVTIDSQTWLAENLKTTKYNDGTEIPLVTDDNTWYNLLTPTYCWYNNDENASKNIYGALYNWYTVETGKLCPAGWHVPTDDEWTAMENYLIANGFNYDGSVDNDGDRSTLNKIAKSLAVNTNWLPDNFPGNAGNPSYPEKFNTTGFSGLPAGRRTYSGPFWNIGVEGCWWTSTAAPFSLAIMRFLRNSDSGLNKGENAKVNGFSIRCMRDH
jgi:uncharacterized protein (TIGR02145 family)